MLVKLKFFSACITLGVKSKDQKTLILNQKQLLLAQSLFANHI